MGAIADLLTHRTSQSSGTSTPAQWLIDWVSGGSESSSGVAVTESSALKYTPFWACVRVISGTLASLPFLSYKRVDAGKEITPNTPAYKLMHDRPNEYIDAVTFIESRQAHVLTYGNGYAEIQRNGAGLPIALWPLLPDKTERKIDESNVPYYEVTDNTGTKHYLADRNVLHIKGLGFDGYTGYSVAEYHKEAIGYGIAVKEYGSRFFSGDGQPPGVLHHPGELTGPAKENIAKSWEKRHKGLTNSHRIQVLEEGMKYEATGVDPQKAQAIEVQQYTVDDCARIFNMPPHKIASMIHSTFSNIEEQNIDFISTTMLYWFRKWEQEINYKLYMPSQHGKYFSEIKVDAILRGNSEARHNAYGSGKQWGYYSTNDIHRLENMNTIGPEGDIYLQPINMAPIGADTGQIQQNCLKNLVESEFQRIVRGKKGGKIDITWATKVLSESVRAYAAAVNITAEKRVQAALIDSLTESESLTENDAGVFPARVICKLLGGSNGDM